MLRHGVTVSGTNEAADLGIWGEKSSGFRVWGVLYGGLAGGNTILDLVAPDFGGWSNLAEIFDRHRFFFGTHR